MGSVLKKFSTPPYIRTMEQAGRRPIDDIDLAAAIAAALQFEPDVPSTITVDVCRGVVTLLGETETTSQRLAAEAVAYRFEGVLDVQNAITTHGNGKRAG